jgi:Glycosyl hydrolases family 2, sugar binding domain
MSDLRERNVDSIIMPPQIPLSSTWDFRLDSETTWRQISVPGCWEQIGVRKDCSGPAWYRTTFTIPAEWADKRIWLRFGAVSYDCEIFVNGQALGSHTGLWDSFVIEISAAVAPGATAELLVRVEKPAGLTAGPDSAALPGRFPLRETLAGFLPYVWGHIFGGIWQDVTLYASGATIFEDVLVRSAADGRVSIAAALSGPGEIAIEIRDPDGELVYTTIADAGDDGRWTMDERRDHRPSSTVYRHSIETAIPNPRPWSPTSPSLYEARLRAADGDERVLCFGLRSLRAEGTTLLLNEQPIYPRMALSWGWYPQALHSNPGPERVRADFARLQQLGYNGVKLCLWFPPQYYFDLADELGMLLWVELPMWLPQPSAFFRTQTPIEYERLMRQARAHPSVILYTLGCELNHVVDAALLAPLYATVKAHAGDALVRDNSGSGAAYGGLLNEFAEFYDYHFYAELQHLRGLLDHFAPRWRPEQPWVFGEFCDYDTFRLQIDESDPQFAICNLQYPWWMLDDPEQNPQGARWAYEVVKHAQRLRASGLWERSTELKRISELQGLLHRKQTLELVRLYREVSGYVVTGEADTPISSAGMWDASDRLKFAPAAFRAFNADLVLLLGWDQRREWAGGGDRAAPWDTWSYPGGATVRPHLVASHYGSVHGRARVTWAAALAGASPFVAGEFETSFALVPGSLRELGVAEFVAPDTDRPRQVMLKAEVDVGDEHSANEWPLWLFPRHVWRTARAITLLDPSGRLRDLPGMAPGMDGGRKTEDEGTSHSSSVLHPSSVILRLSSIIIATTWTPELRAFVERGGRALLLQAGDGSPGPLPVVALPFWREAIRLAAPHPAWRDFPLDDAMGMQFFGCATDCALDLSAFEQPWSPIFRRLDARTMLLHEYAAELAWGAGRLIVTTLRFEGRQGAQPWGITRNTAAAYLLGCWAMYLQEIRDA